MIDCLVLGDSIAVGTQMHYKECAIVGKGGINSWQFNRNYEGEFYSNTVIISLGSNDHMGVRTKKELEKLRARVVAKTKVYWILPANKENIRQIVTEVANNNGDVVIPIKHLQPDNIHPSGRGYKDIVNQINNGN